MVRPAAAPGGPGMADGNNAALRIDQRGIAVKYFLACATAHDAPT